MSFSFRLNLMEKECMFHVLFKSKFKTYYKNKLIVENQCFQWCLKKTVLLSISWRIKKSSKTLIIKCRKCWNQTFSWPVASLKKIFRKMNYYSEI